uniref:Uncharacterized protein n=1 Tax=Sphaerodactylus townsendi TaxID=933632 RepID=A0ACB8FX77_9SAUR
MQERGREVRQLRLGSTCKRDREHPCRVGQAESPEIALGSCFDEDSNPGLLVRGRDRGPPLRSPEQREIRIPLLASPQTPLPSLSKGLSSPSGPQAPVAGSRLPRPPRDPLWPLTHYEDRLGNPQVRLLAACRAVPTNRLAAGGRRHLGQGEGKRRRKTHTAAAQARKALASIRDVIAAPTPRSKRQRFRHWLIVAVMDGRGGGARRLPGGGVSQDGRG